LLEYFPTPLRKTYLKDIRAHRLRREIIATRITNSMINRVGGTFISEYMEKTGKSAAQITREVFKLRDLWQAIEKLDNRVPSRVQAAMTLDINHLIEWVTLWFLRNVKAGLDIGPLVREFRDGIATLSDGLGGSLPAHYMQDIKKRAEPYTPQGVPEALALRIANLVNLYSACDIVRLANRRKLPVNDVSKIYFGIGTHFHLGRLRAAGDQLAAGSHWQYLAVAALTEKNIRPPACLGQSSDRIWRRAQSGQGGLKLAGQQSGLGGAHRTSSVQTVEHGYKRSQHDCRRQPIVKHSHRRRRLEMSGR